MCEYVFKSLGHKPKNRTLIALTIQVTVYTSRLDRAIPRTNSEESGLSEKEEVVH
jgi:hypothetical protein